MSFLAFEETRELTRVVRSAQAALDAIDELMNSLFEFGGESAGRVCSIATSIAKGAFSETKVQLLMVRNPKSAPGRETKDMIRKELTFPPFSMCVGTKWCTIHLDRKRGRQ